VTQFDFDDLVVYQAFVSDYPETAEVFDDIKATIDRI